MHPVFFEVVIFALIVVVAVTQVILPTIANAPLFPSFRFNGPVGSAPAAAQVARK